MECRLFNISHKFVGIFYNFCIWPSHNIYQFAMIQLGKRPDHIFTNISTLDLFTFLNIDNGSGYHQNPVIGAGRKF